MRILPTAHLLVFLLLSSGSRAEEVDMDWLVRTSRLEGAASDIREHAAQLRETAAAIQSRGRLSSIAVLVSDAQQLNRRVVAGELAAGVLK